MHTRTAHVTFQHLGILQRIAHQRVGRCFRSLKLRHIGDGIGEIQFLIGNFIGN